MATEQQEKRGLRRLSGKKVWVVQYDDEDDSIVGILDDVADGFICLRVEGEEEPTLFVNLQNVKEVEMYRETTDGGGGGEEINTEDGQHTERKVIDMRTRRPFRKKAEDGPADETTDANEAEGAKSS